MNLASAELANAAALAAKPKTTRVYFRRVNSIGFVDKGACEGAEIICLKKHQHTEGNGMETSVKAQAWAKIVELGKAEQERNPALSAAQARLHVTKKTAEGAKYLAMYNDPDASLSVDAFDAKKASRANLAALGYANWDQCIAALSRNYAATRPEAGRYSATENLLYGRCQVQKHAPEVWARAQEERGRPAA